MNGSDGVDLTAALLPKRLRQVAVLVFVGLLVFQYSLVTRWLLWYANDKARGIVDTVLDQTTRAPAIGQARAGEVPDTPTRGPRR